MANRFEVIDGADVREFMPYNYDDVAITYQRLDKPGAYQLVPNIEAIMLYASDFSWLLPRMQANKCNEYFIKYYCDGVLKYTGIFNYFNCSIDNDNCIMTVQPKYYSANLNTFLENWEEEYDLDDVLNRTLIKVDSAGLNYNYAKKLQEFIDYFVADIGCSWTSRFLDDPSTPMVFPILSYDSPFNVAESNSPNPYKHIFFCPSDSNSNKSVVVSIGKILEILCEQYLNLRWIFNETTNTLIIEHLSYFENSLSYANPASVSIDATTIDGGKWLRETNKYVVDEKDYYNQEIWSPNIAKVNGIQYNYSFQWFYNCDVLKQKIRRIPLEYDTHVLGVEQIGEETIMLCACYYDNALANYYIWEWEDPVNPGTYIVNYYFKGDMLWVYWMHNRPFPSARRFKNATDKAMHSTSRPRTQRISLPLCCNDANTLNEYYLVKTNIGNGYLSEYKHRIASGMYDLTLKFDDV